jgi:hypothetical protein
VVDLITNLDMAGFQNHGGLAIVLNRLEVSNINEDHLFHILIAGSDLQAASRLQLVGWLKVFLRIFIANFSSS